MKIRAIVLILIIAGCKSVPTPFETGEVVKTPSGCKTERNIDC
jgi:hypothetical protein